MKPTYHKIGVLLLEELNNELIKLLKTNGYALCIDESDEGVVVEILEEI